MSATLEDLCRLAKGEGAPLTPGRYNVEDHLGNVLHENLSEESAIMVCKKGQKVWCFLLGYSSARKSFYPKGR